METGNKDIIIITIIIIIVIIIIIIIIIPIIIIIIIVVVDIIIIINIIIIIIVLVIVNILPVHYRWSSPSKQGWQREDGGRVVFHRSRGAQEKEARHRVAEALVPSPVVGHC